MTYPMRFQINFGARLWCKIESRMVNLSFSLTGAALSGGLLCGGTG